MGLLTFALNVTLDGCYDHTAGVPSEAVHDYFTKLIADSGALLYGRVTYELMEGVWPHVARDESAPPTMRDFARALEGRAKHVVSTTRRAYAWGNTFHVEGDLEGAVKALKEKTPEGVLASGVVLSAELERLGLIDEYRIVVHPVLAGRGPTLAQGFERARRLERIATKELEGGAVAMHYRGLDA